MRLAERVGHKFGKLTVKSQYKRQEKDRKRTVYICECECGNVTEISTINWGKTVSCGCYKKESQKLAGVKRTLPNKRNIKNQLYLSYKRKDKRARELEFTLTFEEFEKLILSNCLYCDSEPFTEFNVRKNSEIRDTMKYTGIDRIDSDKGYTLENVVPCCKNCNMAKCRLSQQQFRDLIERLHKNLNNWEAK